MFGHPNDAESARALLHDVFVEAFCFTVQMQILGSKGPCVCATVGEHTGRGLCLGCFLQRRISLMLHAVECEDHVSVGRNTGLLPQIEMSWSRGLPHTFPCMLFCVTLER